MLLSDVTGNRIDEGALHLCRRADEYRGISVLAIPVGTVIHQAPSTWDRPRVVDGTRVPAVARALLQQPLVVPIAVAANGLPLVRLRLAATSESTWAWSIHELTLWERR